MAVATRVHDRSELNRRDAEQVARALAGDQEAYCELRQRFRGLFLNWIRHNLKDPSWAGSCADGAIAQVFEYLHTYIPTKSVFHSWAFRVCYTNVFKYINQLDLNRMDVSLDDVLLEVLPAMTGPEYDYVFTRLHEALDALPPDRRAAVKGAFLDDRSDAEIAEELGLSVRRVCYRRQQGLRDLRKALSDIPLNSIRPEMRETGYNYIMADVLKNDPKAQLGGEDGD